MIKARISLHMKAVYLLLSFILVPTLVYSIEFTEHVITTNTNGATSVYAVDVDGDGDMDLLSASYSDDTIAWYENDGSESFTVHIITTDADGDIDVLSASANDDTIAWYENDGSESFTKIDITTDANYAHSVYAADMNADGFLNILDVVSLINQILSNNGGLTRGKTATEAAVKYGNGMMSYESDGVIAGVQLFVTGSFEITDIFLPSGWDISSNESTIIFYSQDGSHLDDSRLFSYEGDLKIESSIFADWHGSSISSKEMLLPGEYALDNAYPNPFNPVTNVGFAISEDGYVTISVYDLQGRQVAELIDGNKVAGFYKLSWNASSEASGIYFVRMKAGTYVSDQKIMLVK